MNPLGIFQIISAIGPILTSALQIAGVIPANYAPLVTGLETSIGEFGQAITSSSTGQFNVNLGTILTGISAAVSVLQAETTLDPAVLTLVNALDKAVGAGFTAYQQALTTVNPSTLAPITPVA